MRITVIVLGLVACFLFGCSHNEPDLPENELYHGTLWFDLDPFVVGQSFEDTVELEVYAGRFWFTTLVHTDNSGTNPPLCNCSGSVFGFGTNVTTFSPTDIDSADCRSRWVISGDFAAVFKGDSLTMTRNVDSAGVQAEYLLKLLRKR